MNAKILLNQFLFWNCTLCRSRSPDSLATCQSSCLLRPSKPSRTPSAVSRPPNPLPKPSSVPFSCSSTVQWSYCNFLITLWSLIRPLSETSHPSKSPLRTPAWSCSSATTSASSRTFSLLSTDFVPSHFRSSTIISSSKQGGLLALFPFENTFSDSKIQLIPAKQTLEF